VRRLDAPALNATSSAAMSILVMDVMASLGQPIPTLRFGSQPIAAAALAAGSPNVRYGSKADICSAPTNVRFTF
jgi:hypothetical protein